MGESEKSRAARQYYNDIGGLQNRFDNYSSPFDYSTISKNIGDIFSNQEGIINRDTAEAIKSQQSGAGASLASRGITGGSALTDTQSKIASDINKSKANALARLGVSKASSIADLMQYFNNLDLQTNNLASSFDLDKFRLRGGALQGLDDTTAWDDIFGGLTAGGQAAAGAASLITALSDARFKENVTKLGEINGINVYEFSYIGSDDRYIGVLAHEVPHAVEIIGGIKFVNYSKLPGIYFRKI